MPLLSLEELAQELGVSVPFILELMDEQVIIPHGGRARIGEPRFSLRAVPHIREKIRPLLETH